jgi:hypothetical protein
VDNDDKNSPKIQNIFYGTRYALENDMLVSDNKTVGTGNYGY